MLVGRMIDAQSPGTALDVATQATNPGPGSEPLKLWFKVLSDLQYMDTVREIDRRLCTTTLCSNLRYLLSSLHIAGTFFWRQTER